MSRAATGRRRRGAWGALAPLALALAGAGCVSSVEPPERVADPVAVYLVGEARHRGLVLPDGEARYVEYGYGEWGWYALGHDAWYDACDTVLWPTRGALSQRLIRAASAVELRARRAPGELAELAVERAAVERLRAGLASCFERRAASAVRRAELDAAFVPADERFWFAHNCHDALAEWLRELGCRVSAAPVRVGLELRVRE